MDRKLPLFTNYKIEVCIMKKLISITLLVSVLFAAVAYAQEIHQFEKPLYFPTNQDTTMYDSDGSTIMVIPRGTMLVVIATFEGNDRLGYVIAGLKTAYGNFSGVVRLAHINIE
jgi:hypothetical protein